MYVCMYMYECMAISREEFISGYFSDIQVNIREQ